MPRKPAVSPQKMLEVLKSFEGIVREDGSVPGPRAEVWRAVREALEGKVSFDLLYQNVHDNRHNILDSLKGHFNIQLPENASEEIMSESSKSEHDNSSLSLSSTSETTEKPVILPQQLFALLLSPEDWTSIKPVEKWVVRKDRASKRRILQMPPYEWEGKIINACWEQHKIPCPYTFDRAYVSDAPSREQFIKIEASCRECGAQAIGRMLTEPRQGESAVLEWRANDSRKVPHYLNRPLYRKERKDVARTLMHKPAVVFRRQKAAATMQQGDVKCPTLYSSQVLRVAKHQQLDLDLNIPSKVQDPVQRLVLMKHSVHYAGSIHDISIDKFFVSYRTPSQDLVYRQHCAKAYVSLAIDATGTLTQKLPRPHGLSGTIFLYEGVIHVKNSQLPVWQVLSERHDANTIAYWINQWLMDVKIRPQEVVIDDSRALKSAVSRAFCGCSSVAELKERYFAALTGTKSVLPPCFIRLDIAHVINACRKSLKCGKELKGFFLRCLGILALARSLEAFETYLYHLFIVMLSRFEGKDVDGEDLPMEVSLRFLTQVESEDNSNLIPFTDDCDVERQAVTTTPESSSLPDCEDNVSEEEPVTLNTWLNEIMNKAREFVENAEAGSCRLNGYHSEDVAKQFLERSKDFPLWSAVMVNHFNSPYLTSSAPVESDFGDLKNRVLSGVCAPLSVDRMVATHIKSIEGMCRIAAIGEPKEILRTGARRQQDSIAPGGDSSLISNKLSQQDCSALQEEILQEDIDSQQHDLNFNEPGGPAIDKSHTPPNINPGDEIGKEEGVQTRQKRMREEGTNLELQIKPESDSIEANKGHREGAAQDSINLGTWSSDDISTSPFVKETATSSQRKEEADPAIKERAVRIVRKTSSEEELTTGTVSAGIENESVDSPILLKKTEDSSEKAQLEESWGEDFEDWRGLISKEERKCSKKTAKYLSPNSHLNAAIHGKQLKEPRSILLRNGNGMKVPMPIGPNASAIITNTCPFDTICQSLALMYINNEAYRDFVDNSDNELLAAAKTLATKGAATAVYRMRAALLTKVLKPKSKLQAPQNLRSKTARTTEIYDCWGSVITLTETLLKNSPSVWLNSVCARCGSNILYTTEDVNVNVLKFFSAGVSSIEELVEDFISSQTETCLRRSEKTDICNCKEASVEAMFSSHLLIVADHMAGPSFQRLAGDSPHFRLYSLNEFPIQLNVRGNHFILHAVIAHRPGHFVTYCRKKADWYVYDGLCTTPILVKDDLKVVNPQILLYGKQHTRQL